ncbi:MAG TPA: hypothetical protein VFA03_04240 [Acetobacteraceae bacterium]|nr:hypothetical protein [Acetobacteraceae bacterium]
MHRSLARRPALLAAIAALLASCRLIDQTTFKPAPEAKPPAPAPAGPALDTRTALMVIEPGTQLENYKGVLHDAVAAARARNPEVVFDVISVVPGRGSLSDQVKAADALRPQAVAVAQALIESGAPMDRVELGARPDPQVQRAEIRVYVR